MIIKFLYAHTSDVDRRKSGMKHNETYKRDTFRMKLRILQVVNQSLLNLGSSYLTDKNDKE